MSVLDTLAEKRAGVPTWVWAVLGTGALALYLVHRKNTAAASGSTTAAAGQSNSDLGSAAELANFFQVAGLMPYQGGNVYVNTTDTPPAQPSEGPHVYNKKGQDIGPNLYGQAQIDFIKANLGKYSYSSALLSDVQNAYNEVARKYGTDVANKYHYTRTGSHKVTAVPVGSPGTTGPISGLK